MAENSEILTHQEEKMSLLPRSAWKSQLQYLKALLKAKQALDRRERESGNKE